MWGFQDRFESYLKRRNKVRKLLSYLLSVALLLLTLAGAQPALAQQNPPSNQSFVAGRFVARNYNYPGVRINGGGGAAGTTYSIQVSQASVRLPDGRTVVPFSGGGLNILGQPGAYPAIPVTVGSGTTQETVTPTSVTGCYIGAPQTSCTITAAFTNAHGQGEIVTSGSDGIQEAINDAAFWGGGVVSVDPSMAFFQGGITAVRALIAAASVMPMVSIEDTMQGPTTYWNPTQGGAATVFSAPTVLAGQAACDATHNFCSDSVAVGTWAAVAYFGCIAYVDIMGQEGPCSTTATFTAVVSKAIDVGAPAAATGAVGYVIYIGTSYLLASSVAITPSVCTMTTLETITPACAVTNTTYGQAGSTFGVNALFTGGAQVATLTVVTSPGKLLATTASATTAYIGTPNGRSTGYVYGPSSHMGIPGVLGVSRPFTITSAAATTVPNVVATVNMPPGVMNYLGRGFRVCGFGSSTGTSTATIVGFTLWWEAAPSNASGPLPLIIGGPNVTGTLASAVDNYSFCQEFTTVTTGATGTVLPGFGFETFSDTVAGTHPFSGPNVQVGAPAGMSLTGGVGFPTHLHVVYLHTTGTDGAGIIWQKLTIEPL
jgi:hypothetical protein